MTDKQKQVDALESTIVISVLQGFGAKMGKEVSHILAKVDLQNDVTELFVDNEKMGDKELAQINDYKVSMKPAIDGEAKDNNCKPMGFELEVTKETGRFRLEVFGDNITTGEPMAFLIPAVELVHYAK